VSKHGRTPSADQRKLSRPLASSQRMGDSPLPTTHDTPSAWRTSNSDHKPSRLTAPHHSQWHIDSPSLRRPSRRAHGQIQWRGTTAPQLNAAGQPCVWPPGRAVVNRPGELDSPYQSQWLIPRPPPLVHGPRLAAPATKRKDAPLLFGETGVRLPRVAPRYFHWLVRASPIPRCAATAITEIHIMATF
jgi:hypothetical protein